MRKNLLPKDVITNVNTVSVMGLETYYCELWKHLPGPESAGSFRSEALTGTGSSPPRVTESLQFAPSIQIFLPTQST